MQIGINQVRLVLLGSEFIIPDKLNLTHNINEQLGGLFNGDPVILPFPEGTPLEIPRILLTSKRKDDKDEEYKLQICGNRIDLFLTYPNDKQVNQYPIPGFYEKFLSIYGIIAGNIKGEIKRIAVATNWDIKLDVPAAALLQSKYLKSDAPFKNPSELEIHFLTKELLAGFESNVWARIKSAHKKSAPEQNDLVVLLTDINTIPEKAYSFTKETLSAYLDEASKITNRILESNLKKLVEQ